MRKRKQIAPIQQPRPVFFTEEQIKRMEKQEGSYQYKGDRDGKKTAVK